MSTVINEIERMGENAGEDAENGLKSGRKLVRQVARAGKKSLSTAKNYCEEHPLESMGWAAAAGVLAGLVISVAFQRRTPALGRKVGDLFGSGQKAWDRMESGLEQAADGMKEAFKAIAHTA